MYLVATWQKSDGHILTVLGVMNLKVARLKHVLYFGMRSKCQLSNVKGSI